MLSKSTLTGIVEDFILFFFSRWIFSYSPATDFSQYYINMHLNTTVEMNYVALGVLIKDYMHSMIYLRWAKVLYSLMDEFKLGTLLDFLGLGINVFSLRT